MAKGSVALHLSSMALLNNVFCAKGNIVNRQLLCFWARQLVSMPAAHFVIGQQVMIVTGEWDRLTQINMANELKFGSRKWTVFGKHTDMRCIVCSVKAKTHRIIDISNIQILPAGQLSILSVH